MCKKCYFNKETTNIIKGIMLILMFILHLFCFPSWYVSNVNYPDLACMEKYQGHFQICIAGFTYLTGYLYYYSKSKNFNYICKKWMHILIPYWLIFAVFFFMALITNTYTGSLKNILFEIFALDSEVMCFGWYVSYYIVMLLGLWVLGKYISNSIVLWGISVIGSTILSYAITITFRIEELSSLFVKFQVYFPITVTGYVCAKEKIFERINNKWGFNRAFSFFSFITIVLVVFMEPSWLYGFSINNIFLELVRKSLRIISIPFFIYALIQLCTNYPIKLMNKCLSIIGKYSMEMWFFHCIFFNCSKEIFQKYLFMPYFPVLVLIWGLLLSLVFSIFLKSFEDVILKRLKI